MPKVEATATINVDVWTAFAVSQTTGEVRLRWDPFIKRQHHLGAATVAAKGVQTETISRHGLRMVSEYASFVPPDRVGMRMVEGPWFFERFGGGWVFRSVDGGARTEATWRYTFTVRPAVVAPIADRIGSWILGRDIERRIDAFRRGCADPHVLGAAQDLMANWR